MARPTLFLIDTFGYLFRAYHARARSAAPPMRTSAGLSTEAVYIFHNMLRKLLAAHKPDYVAAIFESAGPTFREQEFAAYKANRAETPADLTEQIPYVRRLLEGMRVPTAEFSGFEADDVIGAIARGAAAQGVDVVIVSSDKDMLQLVNDRVRMLNPMKDDTLYDAGKAQEFMGVPPPLIPDLLALKGDAIDNIPGAPGIGEKGARDLILRFGPVEQVLDRAAEVERKTYRESLLANREQVMLSKRLATIDTGVPVEWSLSDYTAREPDPEALKELFRELEFFSLLKELGPSEAAPGDYATLETAEAAEAFLSGIGPQSRVALAIAPPAEGELLIEPVLGIASSAAAGRTLPFRYLDKLKPILEDPARAKIVHDAKAVHLALEREGVRPTTLDEDVMLYAFLLTADPASCQLSALSERYLDRRLTASADQQAAVIFALAERLGPEVETRGLRRLYEDIDRPLSGVLLRMERAGIRVERTQLAKLSTRLEAEIQALAAEIHSLAGKPFNINSPQQLAKVLFEDLKLPAPFRYGKGKQVSTAADVLETLAPEHPIAARVLDYRQLVKLKGTYVDALPEWINSRDGRLHTSFNQAGAATGRLSSANPNLQNIPIRTELGREIRAAFVPEPGWKLVVADYSQIELRLLAHLSRDPVLVDAFEKGQDIHTRTACEVFGVAPEQVTPEMRRNAKAVNFGIVYGQTPFGLAAQLGIPRAEADSYIRGYFARYAGVKQYIDATVAEVRASGVSRTMFGRERPMPDIRSRNPNARSFAERTAVNTPLQGAAADLIKLAMIRIDAELARAGWASRMLLQVHDELVLESPPGELERLGSMVKREMETVHPLSVPLVVEVGVGDNWRDAK